MAIQPMSTYPSARVLPGRDEALMLLVGGLVALEFLENGMFVFAASYIVGGVDAAPREFAQVQASYAVGSMLMIVVQQSLSRRFGYRRYLTGALALLFVGTTAAAAADGLVGLTVARFVQGFGAGALFTSARILINVLFPPAERGPALTRFTVLVFSAGACAPIAAAMLVEHGTWRWVFAATLPLMALAIVATWSLLPDRVGRGDAPVRWAVGPLTLAVLALTTLQLSLSEARYDVFGHRAPWVVLTAVGVALTFAFLLHQWHHAEPLIRLRELKHPAYLVGLSLYFLNYVMAGAASYLFPIYAHGSLGLPLIATGWLDTFAALVSLVAGYVYVKVGPRIPQKKAVMALGAALMAISSWLLSRMPPDPAATDLLPALFARGLFGVFLLLPVAGLTFRDLGEERFAHGYQGKNLMRQLATSFSTAAAAIVLQDRQFANYTSMTSTLSASSPNAASWLDHVREQFAATGLGASESQRAALAELGRVVDRQVQLIACEDLFRVLTVVACATTAFIVVQRRLR